jgi:hypothetical protein
MPRTKVLAPSTWVIKKGLRLKIITDDIFIKKDTHPNAQMLRGRDGDLALRDLLFEFMSVFLIKREKCPENFQRKAKVVVFM